MAENYYEVLELTENSPMQRVREAYRDRVKEVHPDTNGHPDAKQQFLHLKTAYDVLSNRKERQRYENLDHDEYVNKYGGYFSSELREVDEPLIVAYEQPGSLHKTQTNSYQERESKNGGDIDESDSLGWLEYVLQGRTSNRDGSIAYFIRFLVYITILLSGWSSLSVVFGVSISNSLFGWVALLLVTRLTYLLGFEQLRTRFIKIDNSPEPDAWTVPYPMAAALAGFIFIFIHTSQFNDPVSLIGFVGSTLLLLPGYLGLILSVGWGVADDYYNLKYDTYPPLWNLLVQGPVLMLFALLWTGSASEIPPTLLGLMSLLPCVVAGGYLALYHPEVGSELLWRIKHRQVTST